MRFPHNLLLTQTEVSVVRRILAAERGVVVTELDSREIAQRLMTLMELLWQLPEETPVSQSDAELL